MRASIEGSSLARLVTAVDKMPNVTLQMVPRIRFEDNEWFPDYTTIGDDMFVSLSGSTFGFAKMVSGSIYGVRRTNVFDELKQHRTIALLDSMISPPEDRPESKQHAVRRRGRAKNLAKAMERTGELRQVVDVKLPSIAKGDTCIPSIVMKMVATTDGKAQCCVQLSENNINYIIAAIRSEEAPKEVRKRPDPQESHDLKGNHRLAWDRDRMAWIARAEGKCQTFRPQEGEPDDAAGKRAKAWIKMRRMGHTLQDTQESLGHKHEETQESACSMEHSCATPSHGASADSQPL